MYMKQIIKKFQNSMEAKRLKRFREETDLLISLLEKYSELLNSQQSNFTFSLSFVFLIAYLALQYSQRN